MTVQFLDPPPTERPRRRLVPLLWKNDEIRAVEIGIVGTILIHVFFFLFAPTFLSLNSSKIGLGAPKKPQTFHIKLVPPPPKVAPPIPHAVPKKFVEANPNAPSNKPDKTNNFSFMDQQVAQEKPNPKGHSDMPSTQGRKDIQSNQIVTGQLSKPEPIAPVVPKVQPAKTPAKAAPRREQDPLTGTEKDLGKDPNGFGTNISKDKDNPQQVPDQVTGAKDVAQTQSSSVDTPAIDPTHPRPRPTLEQHVRPAIFSQNDLGTSNMGITALDARFNHYGEYLHRMLEIIQSEWDRILDNTRVDIPRGTTVTVQFKMNSDGNIVAIVKHESNSSEFGTTACITAITNPQPYGKWTDDMIAVLGSEQELMFTFYYE